MLLYLKRNTAGLNQPLPHLTRQEVEDIFKGSAPDKLVFVESLFENWNEERLIPKPGSDRALVAYLQDCRNGLNFDSMRPEANKYIKLYHRIDKILKN